MQAGVALAVATWNVNKAFETKRPAMAEQRRRMNHVDVIALQEVGSMMDEGATARAATEFWPGAKWVWGLRTETRVDGWCDG